MMDNQEYQKLLELEHRLTQGFSGVAWRQDAASEERTQLLEDVRVLRENAIRTETRLETLEGGHAKLSDNVRDVELTGAHKLADIRAEAAMHQGTLKAADKMEDRKGEQESRDIAKWKINAALIMAGLGFAATLIEKLVEVLR